MIFYLEEIFRQEISILPNIAKLVLQKQVEWALPRSTTFGEDIPRL